MLKTHSVEVACLTRTGKKRNINEDSVLSSTCGRTQLVAVADGLGGHVAGEVASKLAVTELERCFRSEPADIGILETMKTAIARANAAIFRMSVEDESCKGMASTVVAAAFVPPGAIVANVGDSRAYLIGTTACRVTKDHSLVQQLIDERMISQDEAHSHSQKNVVTRSLGIRKSVSAEFYVVDLSGKTLMLCSDGLSDSLLDEEIGDIYNRSVSLEEACSTLIAAAQGKGSTDDITVILAKQADLSP